jgi:hypothetical protein
MICFNPGGLIEMNDVFISYAREDSGFVRTLFNVLSERDRKAWVDWKNIPPSVDWKKEIFAAIESAFVFVFVISPDSIASDVCREELDHALKYNKKLVPLIYRELPRKEIHRELKDLNWIFFREKDDFKQGMSKLIEAIETDFDWVRMHTRLLMLASEWREKQENSLLLRGKNLKEAQDWLSIGFQAKFQRNQRQVLCILNLLLKVPKRRPSLNAKLSPGYPWR